MQELAKPTPTQMERLRAFARCVRTIKKGKELLSQGAKAIKFLDSKGNVILKADQTTIRNLEEGSLGLYEDLVHPLEEKDGKLVKATNEDMKAILGEIIKLSNGENLST